MELIEKRRCTGCMACVQTCPKSCIRVEKDVLGNLYPVIDATTCIECGKCQKVCPEIMKLTYRPINKAYAAWSLDSTSRKTSASGGAAAEFYAQALQEGYYICGVEYKQGFHVVHTLSKNVDSINVYKQSKYVYSEVGTIYNTIKEKLECNEKVLMISLPCKIAGLLGYLGKQYDNLITVDIVCHGTPSQQLLAEYIDLVDASEQADKLSFRVDNEFAFGLRDKDGGVLYQKEGRTDAYLAAFLEGLDYRESCYHCSYARPERISDITICDFWGLGLEIPFDYPYTGSVSAVLLNSETGQAFFERCKHRLFVEERPVWEAVKGNAQLNQPTPRHPKRAEFEQYYSERGFQSAVDTCLGKVMKAARRSFVKNKIYHWLRKIAKVCLRR